MKFNVTIDTGEMPITRFIEWIGRAMDENSANESRAWMLYTLGESQGRTYCEIPNGEEVGFGNDLLADVLHAAIDAEEDEDDQREV